MSKLQRFDVESGDSCRGEYPCTPNEYPDDNGEWVKFADAEQAISTRDELLRQFVALTAQGIKNTNFDGALRVTREETKELLSND